MTEPVATVIRVTIACDGEIYYATSDDVYGLNLAARDRGVLMQDIPKAIELLYRENHGVRVVAKPFAEAATFPNPVLRDGTFVVETEGEAVQHAATA